MTWVKDTNVFFGSQAEVDKNTSQFKWNLSNQLASLSNDYTFHISKHMDIKYFMEHLN